MFWKRIKFCVGQPSERELRRIEEARREDMRIEYQVALEHVDLFLSYATTAEEKKAILNYAIKVVKRDLIGEGLSQIVYGKEAPEWRAAFPSGSQAQKDEYISIELSKSDVLVTPWERSRLPEAIRDLLYSLFDQQKDYYTAKYYPEIDLAIIGNGMHHIAVASVGAGGVIDRCSVVRMAPAFEEVSTDGATWMNSKAGSVTGVSDFRFALLFTLAKMRYELENTGASS